jgi:tRNA pseudouridine(55) synthase
MHIAYKNPGVPFGDITKKVADDSQNKISYIGRLDPLASGIIIYLEGDELKDRDKYMNMDKTYKFNLVIGISTDTGDCLGMIRKIQSVNTINMSKLLEVFSEFFDEYEQKYPIYSAYQIHKNGMKKPLWYFAKNGIELEESEIPRHVVKIYNLEQDAKPIYSIRNMNYFMEQVGLIPDGLELRKEEVIMQYKEYKESDKIRLIGIPMLAKVSSGTYIRQLCADIGDKLGVPCMADKIERVGYHFQDFQSLEKTK